MGQTISSSRSKNSNKRKDYYGSTIFGYKYVVTSASSSTTTVYLNEHNDDNVLFQPFLYGLAGANTTANHSTFSQLSSLTAATTIRSDSGFPLYEKNSQLWKDLTYIDQTHYQEENDLPFLLPLVDKQQEEHQQRRDAITFHDILHMCQQQSMQNIDLSKRGFGSISSNIGLLPMIRKLDLSYNDLKEIPSEIGYLHQLEQFNISHNQIDFIPDSICHLTSLTEFNASNNQLQEITPFIFYLEKLQTLNISYNQLKQIDIMQQNGKSSSSLALLDLSYNPIPILPAEITRLPYLRRLRLEGCPLTNSFHQFKLSHNPPSLLEICARLIIKKKLVTSVEQQEMSVTTAAVDQKKQQQKRKRKGIEQDDDPITTTNAIIFKLKKALTESLFQYISNFRVCSHCDGPYFDSFVSRGRWIDRNEVWIPLEYRLCSAHWSTEPDRVYSMFSSSLPTEETSDLLPLLNLVSSTALPPLVPPPTAIASTNLVKSSTITRRPCLLFRRNHNQQQQQQQLIKTGALSPSPFTEEEVEDHQEIIIIQAPLLTLTTMAAADDQQPIVEDIASSVDIATVVLEDQVLPPQQQPQPQQQQQETSFSFYSAVKRWNYKIRSNSSSLFRKNTGLLY